ncbi:hypothetical protein POTOM_053942 [Populus tomentosa]|uniref:Uncharacterized protein n=1 Tax=Populus tomentosa TaxID=118781 RepID=A0A8X7Y6P2_POPTO|nr:hypothetical protein POTOM_053942 [Populus tomentosa]
MNSKSKLESAMEYKGTSSSISSSEILAPQCFVLSNIIVNNNDDNVRVDKERLFMAASGRLVDGDGGNGSVERGSGRGLAFVVLVGVQGKETGDLWLKEEETKSRGGAAG